MDAFSSLTSPSLIPHFKPFFLSLNSQKAIIPKIIAITALTQIGTIMPLTTTGTANV